ncbi:MAG: hypothetical protein M0R37_07925 [Bacteroidales bacterium]|nr:hypothetical protein [Bacteroidales bacterium]
MSAYGFKFAYRLGGGQPTIQEAVFQDTETLTKGDMLSIIAGSADLGASDAATLAGAALETVAGTTAVSTIRLITDRDAVYSVYDANARKNGTVLDIDGTTGAMTLAADVHHDVIVVADSSATEDTLVTFVEGSHYTSVQKT